VGSEVLAQLNDIWRWERERHLIAEASRAGT
jgi:hypothetical protein